MVIFHGKLLNNQMVIIIRIRSVGVSNEPPLLGSKNGRLMEKMIWDFGVAWKKLRQTQGDQILIGGLEHELCDFPFSWELSSSQLTFTPSFFSRIDTGNIPWGHGISVSGHGSMDPVMATTNPWWVLRWALEKTTELSHDLPLDSVNHHDLPSGNLT